MKQIVVKGKGQADAMDVTLDAGYATENRYADNPVFEKNGRRFGLGFPVWVMTPDKQPLRDVYLKEIKA